MAIFHFSVKPLSRSKGHCAVAASAYRTGQKLRDQRTGITYDFSLKGGVSHTELFLPAGALELSREEYWNQAEMKEVRKNSRVARDLVLSLPVELPPSARVELASKMARWIADRHHCLVDLALHDPTFWNDQRNHHAHLLISTRRLSRSGFTEKTRELDDKSLGAAEIRAWRTQWCEFVNDALRMHELNARVDHRSHRERGLIQIPTIQQGRGPDMWQRVAYNKKVRVWNLEYLSHIDMDIERSGDGNGGTEQSREEEVYWPRQR